jgi:rsbT co-antagonist protein RsbR
MTPLPTNSSETSKFDVPSADILAQFWQASPLALAVISRSGVVLGANQAFGRRLGNDARVLEGEFDNSQNPTSFSPDEPRSQRRIVRFRAADGKVHSIWTIVVRLDARSDTDAAHVLSLNEDVEASNVRSERDRQIHGLERIRATSPLAIVEWDTEGRVTHWNESAEAIFGWTAVEMIGHDFFPRIIPDSATLQVKEVVQALLRGEFANARNANITKNGDIITCQWYNSILRDEHGQIIGVISQAEDVSSEERAKQDLLESKALLVSLIDNLPTAIALKDEAGRHQVINRIFEDWNGKSKEEILGKTDAECWPIELAQLRERGSGHVATSGIRQTREEHLKNEDGTVRECSVLEFPIYDRQGKLRGVCSVATDLTATRHASQEREYLQQQLIETQQNALRELSTPLLPVAHGVLVMPLVGNIDPNRSAMIMDTLLHGIPQHGASVAILDITGVRDIDHSTAEAIVTVARAGKMLGAEVLLTGMRPNVARALVDIGANLEGIVSLGTLRGGIDYALRHNKRH